MYLATIGKKTNKLDYIERDLFITNSSIGETDESYYSIKPTSKEALLDLKDCLVPKKNEYENAGLEERDFIVTQLYARFAGELEHSIAAVESKLKEIEPKKGIYKVVTRIMHKPSSEVSILEKEFSSFKEANDYFFNQKKSLMQRDSYMSVSFIENDVLVEFADTKYAVRMHDRKLDGCINHFSLYLERYYVDEKAARDDYEKFCKTLKYNKYTITFGHIDPDDEGTVNFKLDESRDLVKDSYEVVITGNSKNYHTEFDSYDEAVSYLDYYCNQHTPSDEYMAASLINKITDETLIERKTGYQVNYCSDYVPMHYMFFFYRDCAEDCYDELCAKTGLDDCSIYLRGAGDIIKQRNPKDTEEFASTNIFYRVALTLTTGSGPTWEFDTEEAAQKTHDALASNISKDYKRIELRKVEHEEKKALLDYKTLI